MVLNSTKTELKMDTKNKTDIIGYVKGDKNMYVRFTPKQLSKVKDFLKTASLKGYEIQIYNEILKALEHPIDEKGVKTITIDVENQVVGTSYSKATQNNIKNSNVKQEIAASENIKEEPEKPVPPTDRILKESETKVEGSKKVKEVKETAQGQYKETQNNFPNRSKSLDDAGIFGVIDNRTRK